ncbi:MAG: hypothetical protein HZA54_04760 [Planctomycetes bacterium]|nr:hypothetical protein [Planctomycetota bacterium]
MSARMMMAGGVLCALAVAGAVGAVAAPGPKLTPTDQARRSDLIFAGEVTQIAYARAQAAGEEPGDMHTFVTFRIERLFKGSTAGSTITLRFFGGIGADGLLLRSSHSTLFDVGERSVLFVIGNGKANCPLVGWRGGRFRLVGGAVYSEGGRDVLLPSADRIQLGTQRALDEVTLHQWSESTVTVRLGQVPWDRREQDQLADAGGPAAAPLAAAETAPVAEAAFADWLSALVARVHTPQELAGLAPVSSLDPLVAFTGPVRRPVALRNQ